MYSPSSLWPFRGSYKINCVYRSGLPTVTMRLQAFLFLLSLSACSASTLGNRSPSARTYDYIVVGGGTTGLVVANRLTENANVSVLIIEAGSSAFNNPQVYGTGAYGQALGTAVDWDFKAAPQKYAGNGQPSLHAGKAIGGTSTINGESIDEKCSKSFDVYKECHTHAPKTSKSMLGASSATLAGIGQPFSLIT